VIYAWDAHIMERQISSAEVITEQGRVDWAVVKVTAELSRLRESAGKSMGGPAAKIFDAQLMIAGDQEFLRKVKEEIKSTERNAEFVYSSLVDQSTEPLRRSHDSYMRQMLLDIEAVSVKILGYLTGDNVHSETPFPPNTVIVARRLTPGETLSYHERGAVGIVTAEGSSTSHMALIARALGVPAVVGAEKILNQVRNGVRLIVDGGLGKVYIEPDDALWDKYKRQKRAGGREMIHKLAELPEFPPRTKDKHPVDLEANIELPGPRDKELSERGVGVGLYRTEFIYLQSNHFPPEEEQFETYDAIAAQYAPRHVVMRTFDLGSDKYVEELQPLHESNPALGWRGIRTSLDMPNIFRAQIRAILRASTRKNVKILLPMVTDFEEIVRARKFIRSMMAELRKEKRTFDSRIEIGAMVEVPASALAASTIVGVADFLSIGTNDLVQYTMAVDRDNHRVAGLYNMFHPAPLRLIAMTLDAARRAGKPVTICGEMAGELRALPLLVGMGAKALSMNPTKIYNASRLVSAFSLREAKDLMKKVLAAQTLKETEKLLNQFHARALARVKGVISERA